MTLIKTGHSILHELTHLDSLAKQAGLTAPSEGEDKDQHGTLDAQDKRELTGARDWLEKYEKDSTNISPDYNAESYAAAATGESPKSTIQRSLMCFTEFYFMDLCEFTEIKPLVRQQKSLGISLTEDAANAANISTSSASMSLAKPIPSGSPSGYFNGTSK